ncbi:hypothetical protein ACNKHT_09555 [Shigella flexneri]
MLALPFGTVQKTFIEKATAIKVNVLMALKRKGGGLAPSFNWLMPELLSLFQPER